GERVKNDEILVHLNPGMNIASVVATHLPGAQVRSVGALNLHVVRIPGGLPPGISAILANDPNVDFVEPNRVRQNMLAAPNDPSYSAQWALQTVQALQAWSLLPGVYPTSAGFGNG